ncbi:MAG: 50S ribosomal protein L28 [Planctomycetes bacterium]|nr:50S ribosomal protein L28 [Planctomycetota bacterium]MBI3847504.1 50S ribosomal protein L28 [Planctomycetota bacterium]
MSYECAYCGKRTAAGYQVTRRGLAKRKGGVGKKITGRSKRKFRPNLQTVRAVVDGSPKRIKICAKCIKKGRLTKPLVRPKPQVLTPAAV